MPAFSNSRLAFSGWPLLLLLLAIDGLALVGQLAGSVGAFLGIVPRTPYFLRVEEAYGFASFVIYAKWLAIAVILALAWRNVRQPLLFSLSLIFLLLFIEDSLELHEQLGTMLQSTLRLEDQLGLRGADLGELGGWALIGLPCLLALAYGYARSSPEMCKLGHIFGLGMAGLAFFGIVVAMALRLTEEGGELVIASLLLAFALAILRASPPAAAGTTRTPFLLSDFAFTGPSAPPAGTARPTGRGA